MHRPLAVLLLLAALVAVAPAAQAVPTCGGKRATMVFGDGDNRVRGTSGDDVVVLGAGDDAYLDGRGGSDLVCAGPGADWVSGTSTHVRAYLGPGDDRAQVWQHGRVLGGAGNDWLSTAYGAVARGGQGADELLAQTWDVRIYGGAGDDVLRVGASNPEVVDGQGGQDRVSAWFDDESVEIDLAAGTMYNQTVGVVELTSIENAEGTPHDDIIRGDDGPNLLLGAGGDDQLFGLGGADELWGQYDEDTADGGPGRDTCEAEVEISC